MQKFRENSWTYHPQYPPCDGDEYVHLQSGDGIAFCVHSVTLNISSGFFETTLSLPQGGGSRSLSGQSITLDESEHVVSVLLGIASGKGLEMDKLSTVDAVCDVLGAAEKYDMPGVISMVRLMLSMPNSPFKSDPLRLVSLAQRFEFSPEYERSLGRCLSVDITDPAKYPLLRTLPSPVLTDLLRLSTVRCKILKIKLILLGKENIKLLNKSCLPECAALIDFRYHKWMWAVLEEFRKHPSGDTVINEEFGKRQEVAGLLRPLECNHPYRYHFTGQKNLPRMAHLKAIIRDLPMELPARSQSQSSS